MVPPIFIALYSFPSDFIPILSFGLCDDFVK